MTTTGKAAGTSILASTVLMLAACGGADAADDAAGGSDSPSQATAEAAIYQFDDARVTDSDAREPFVTTEASITVKLSDELKNAVPAGMDITVDHFTLTSKAFSTGACRIDVEVAYADGGQAIVSAPREYDADSPQERAMDAVTDVSGSNSIEVRIVDELPGDDEIQDGTQYISRDSSSMTVVNDCSENPGDDLAGLDFVYQESDSSLTEFAQADIAVIPGGGQAGGEGATTVIEGFSEAEVSPTGKWMQPGD